jgi:hypothetical protein
MYDFIEPIKDTNPELSTGLEVPATDLPRLDTLLGEAGKKLEAALGLESSKSEGISSTRLGLTRLLAEPDRIRDLVGPDGLTADWKAYLELVGIDWSSFDVRRQALELLQSSVGLDRPTLSSESTPFPVSIFDGNASLFEPREFTDPIGRRYLAWLTLDLPEVAPDFDDVPRDLIVSEWRESEARELARKDAEALAAKLVADTTTAPADALAGLASDKTIGSTGQHTRSDPAATYIPLQAGPDLIDALYSLGDQGESRARVAPDLAKDTYYTLVLASRRDRTLPPDATESVDFRNALNNLAFYKNRVDDSSAVRRDDEVMAFLRKKAGLAPNWAPPDEAQRSDG